MNIFVTQLVFVLVFPEGFVPKRVFPLVFPMVDVSHILLNLTVSEHIGPQLYSYIISVYCHVCKLFVNERFLFSSIMQA